MIKFEGFELQNTEDSIINRQLSTRPTIAGLVDSAMKMFGAKEGSSWSEDVSWLTDEQKEGLKGSISGLENLEFKGPGSYTEGMKAEDLEGFRSTSADQLGKLQDEKRLSIAGTEQLRNMMAGASAQVMPDVEALRGLGDKAWAGYDAQLAETTREAREKLQQADIASRRGGMSGGTALARLGARNVTDYGRTVGGAAARAVEQSAIQRQQLALQARMGAGQLMGGLQQRQISGYGTMGQLDLGGLGLTAQDLASRRGLASREKMFGAQHGLDVAKFSEEQATNKNLWAQKNAQMENRFGLDRLSQLGDISTRRTQERVEHVQEGSAGMLPGLVGAGMTMFGGPAGAAAAGPMMSAMSSGYGPSRSGGGGGMDPMMMLAMSGMNASNQSGGGSMNTAGGPPGTMNPASDPSWWDNTKSAVGNWWDDNVTNYQGSSGGGNIQGGQGNILPTHNPYLSSSTQYQGGGSQGSNNYIHAGMFPSSGLAPPLPGPNRNSYLSGTWRRGMGRYKGSWRPTAPTASYGASGHRGY